MLILADPDRLRVDLDQLGQRILQPAGDGDRSPDADVEVGQLLGGIGRGRVDRGPGLGDHHPGDRQFGQPGHQFGGQLVGLPGRRAVADRDQLDVVPARQPLEFGQRLLPGPAGLVRVDRGVGHDLAGRVDHRHLDPGAEARVETHCGAGAGRGGQQQVAQVGREHPDRLLLGRGPQLAPDVEREVDQNPGPVGPAGAVQQPAVGRPAAVGQAEPLRDQPLGVGGQGRVGRLVGVGLEGEVEDLLLLTAEHGQHPVRGQPGVGLGQVEVVGVLGSGALLALPDGRDDPAPDPHPLAQGPDQVGVLGEPFDQDRAGPLERGRGVGDAELGVHEAGRELLRIAGGVAQQPFGQWLEPLFAGDHRLGPALGLVGQVDVLQPRLGVGGQDLRLELGLELALRADRVEDRDPALLQFAQVDEPFLEGAQLRIVQGAGHLLAVPGHERHGGAVVEKTDRRRHLPLLDRELFGDPLLDRLDHGLTNFPECLIHAPDSKPSHRQSGRGSGTRADVISRRTGPDQLRRSLMIWPAASLPGAPITQPPGCVPDPHW